MKSIRAPRASKTSFPNRRPRESQGTIEIHIKTILLPMTKGKRMRSLLVKTPPFPNLNRSCSGTLWILSCTDIGALWRASSVSLIHSAPAHERLHALSNAACKTLSSASDGVELCIDNKASDRPRHSFTATSWISGSGSKTTSLIGGKRSTTCTSAAALELLASATWDSCGRLPPNCFSEEAKRPPFFPLLPLPLAGHSASPFQ